MNFFLNNSLQNEKPSNRLFSSQEIYHKKINQNEMKSFVKSSQIINDNKKSEKKINFNENLSGNLAQKNNKNLIEKNISPNSESNNNKDNKNVLINLKDNNDCVLDNNKNEEINSNINNEKINNIELDNDWNELKINFDNISIVSKVNSCEINNEQSNIIDNNILFKSENLDSNNPINKENKIENVEDENKNDINYKNIKSSFISNSSNNSYFVEKFKIKEEKDFNDINEIKKEKALLEEKLKKEQSLNKEKTYYIEILKKALNDNFLNGQTGIKNIQNLGIVLEYSKCKLENENLKKNIIIQKILCDDMKNELRSLKKEKEKLLEKFDITEKEIVENKREIDDYKLKLKKYKDNEAQLINEINKQREICFNLKKEINNLNNKNLELIEINEKIYKNKSSLNIEEKNNEYYEKIINEKNEEINELKLDKININQNSDKNNNDLINISCKNIEEISKRIKSFYDKNKGNRIQMNEFILKILKEYIDNINPDINGNISLNDKLKIINEFINLIKLKFEILFNHYEIFQINNFNFNRIKIEENEKNMYSASNLKNIFNDSSDINTNRITNYNNDITNDKNMFKKINLFKYKSNKTTNINENNKFDIFNNNDKESIIKDNNDLISNNNISERKKLIFKSSFSEISKNNLDNTNNNREINTKIDDLFSSLFKEKLKNRKNIINLKSKDSTKLINTNSKLEVKNFMNSFKRSLNVSELNISKDISKIDTNIYPSNKNIEYIKEKNEKILSSNNTTRLSLDNKNKKENKIINRTSTIDNINSYTLKTTFPLILTNIPKNKNIYNSTLENNKVMESSYKKKNGKSNKTNLSLAFLQKELFREKIRKNRNHEINELAEEIMRPTFLKTNNTLSINNKHEKEIKKINLFKPIKTNKILIDINKNKK